MNSSKVVTPDCVCKSRLEKMVWRGHGAKRILDLCLSVICYYLFVWLVSILIPLLIPRARFSSPSLLSLLSALGILTATYFVSLNSLCPLCGFPTRSLLCCYGLVLLCIGFILSFNAPWLNNTPTDHCPSLEFGALVGTRKVKLWFSG